MDAITELIKLFQKQNELVNSMATNSGDNSLASKNINNDASNIPSNLKGNEKKRAKELSSIFVTSFFEEQKKREKDTKLGAKTSSPKQDKGLTSIAGSVSPKQGEKAGGGLLDTLMSGLMWALPLIAKLAGKIKAIFGKIGGAFKKLFSKIGSTIKGLFGKIKGAISKMWSSIKNSKIIKALKGYIDDAIKGIKGIFGKIKSKIGNFIKSIGKVVSNMWSKLTSTKAYKSLSKAFAAAKTAISDFFKGIKDKIVNLASKATEKVKNLLPNSLKTAKEGAKSVIEKGKGFVGKILSTGKSIVSTGAGLAVKGAKAVGSVAVKGATAVGSLTASAAKKTVSSAASGIIKSSGGMFKLMGSLTAKTAKGASKIPVIGPAIEGVMAAYDIKGMKEKLAKGEITEEQLQKDAGKRVITGVTGMLGSAGGAVLAGALGSIIPVAGTALGAIAGGLLGDTAGRFLGGLVTDYVIPEKYTKTIGAFVTGTNAPKEEMQDFIIKDGKVHKFSKKDEVMGMKSGGAINDFLKSQHGTQSALYNLYKINHMSAQYLGMIAQNTSIMAKGMKNMNSNPATPIVMNSPQPQQGSTKQMIKIPDNRSAYAGSPYALG